jgi:hypothetical protein
VPFPRRRRSLLPLQSVDASYSVSRTPPPPPPPPIPADRRRRLLIVPVVVPGRRYLLQGRPLHSAGLPVCDRRLQGTGLPRAAPPPIQLARSCTCPRLSCAEAAHPDKLDEEMDTYPTSRPNAVVRVRYGRLRSRSVSGRIQATVRDVATQGGAGAVAARVEGPEGHGGVHGVLLRRRRRVLCHTDPGRGARRRPVRAPRLRHPRFKSRMPSAAGNFFKRLPSRADTMLQRALRSSFVYGIASLHFLFHCKPGCSFKCTVQQPVVHSECDSVNKSIIICYAHYNVLLLP